MKRTVLSMLKNAASEFGDDPYLHDKGDEGWRPKSFRQVSDEAEQFAVFLIYRGLAFGDRMAILAEGSSSWAIGEFGALHAGCISVPLSIQLLPAEIPFRFNHSGVKIVLAGTQTVDKILSVRDTIDALPLIVLLDGTEDTLKDIAAANNLSPGKNILLFPQALREGKDNEEKLRPELEKRISAVKEDDVVTISYTSGTTGDPKGIMLTHLNYWANCKDSFDMFKVPRDFSTILILPCDHSFAHTVGLYVPLLCGIRLFFVDSRGGRMALLRNIGSNIQETKPSFLLSVPAVSGNFMKKIRSGIEAKGKFASFIFNSGMRCGIRYHGNGYNKPSFFTRLLNFIPYRVADGLVFKKVKEIFGGNLQFLVGGGALLDVRQQEFFYTLGIPIYQGYGLTEAAPVISSNMPSVHKLGTSGKVAPTVTCRILTPEGKEAPVGEKGEIVIQGNNVMKGYYKNEEATAMALKNGWLYTGDLGYYDKDGFLVVVGREKSLLIAADGEKYSPEEIEEAIVNTSPYIHQAMVYNNQCKYTTALVTLDTAALKDLPAAASGKVEEVLDAVKESLYAFKDEDAYRNRFPDRWIPSTFQILPEPFTMDNGMVNSTMKIVRFKVFEHYKNDVDYMYTSEGGNYRNSRNCKVLEALLKH
ncbi:MAG: AMP-binding protein [Spirochaetales bacterium]|nr:AMP-binding protein [Spirochaetales bacterium]